MKRFLTLSLPLTLFCSVLSPPALFADKAAQLRKQAAGRWNNDPVEKAIKKGVKYLLSTQNGNGSFGKGDGNPRGPSKGSYKWKSPALRQRITGTVKMKPEPSKHSVGRTAVAIYALLKSDVDIHNDKIQKGLKFIKTYDTINIYALGLRCNAWVTAEKYQPGKYMKYLRHDAQRLLFSIHKDAGGWNYTLWEDTYHNSSAQYGILGVWGYQMLGGEIPSAFWPLALRYWVKGQLNNGGWSYWPPFRREKKKGNRYGQRGSMSAAGLASLFVCTDALMSEKYAKCEGGKLPRAIVKGLDWFNKEFTNTMVGKTSAGRFCYYLYGVERVGRAAGYKYFGKQDWFKLGALALVKKQQGNGSWDNRISSTAFALLFLAKGKHPVMFNKLNFGGDWNNRPRDLANLIRWMSRNYEQEFNWQIVNLQVDPFQWHDAPILYISGSGRPDFSEEEIKKLRTYVYQGGTIFSCAECNGEYFKKGIRDVYKRAFPRYELKKAAPDHPVYSAHARLNGSPELEILSNGARPLVVHTDEDVAKAWQVRAHVTMKKTFLFGVNLTRYIVGSYGDLLPRGRTYWPFPATGTKKTVKVARVKYAGNYDPEPLALVALKRKIARDEKVNLDLQTVPVEKLAGSGAAVALMTGTDGVSLSPAGKKALKAFVASGGTLVVDAAGGSKKFYAAMHGALRGIFGAAALKPLGGACPVYTRGKNPIKKVRYRPAARKRVTSNAVRLEGVTVKGRNAAVILSREDLTAGLLGFESGVVDGYSPDSAYNIVRNIIMVSAK